MTGIPYLDETVRAVLGRHSAQATGWLYVQHQGFDGMVSFVGASRTPPTIDPTAGHPFRFGSHRTHQFVVGAIVLQPGLVVATDTLRGHGLTGLAISDHDIPQMLGDGEIVLNLAGLFDGH